MVDVDDAEPRAVGGRLAEAAELSLVGPGQSGAVIQPRRDPDHVFSVSLRSGISDTVGQGLEYLPTAE